MVDTNTKYAQEQTRKLRRYSTTDIGNGVWQPVQFLMGEPFNQQFNPDQDEKNRNG